MTAMPQSAFTPQSPVSRASLEKMKITLGAVRATILSLNLEPAPAMQMLAEEIMPLAGTVGAAIALKTNGQIVCYASMGQAPPVGAVLQPGQGLSGECVSTGKLVRCDDTDFDSRVNPQICRDLGFRSVLIVPIMHERQSIGLVELLAAQPAHFNDNDVLFLNEVASVVLELNGLQAAGRQIEEATKRQNDEFANIDLNELMSALEQETAEEPASQHMPEINDDLLLERLAFIRTGIEAPAAQPQPSAFTEAPTTPAAKPQAPAVVVRTAPTMSRTRTIRQQDAESRQRLIWIFAAALVFLIVVSATWAWKTHRFPFRQSQPQPATTPSSTATPKSAESDPSSSVASPAAEANPARPVSRPSGKPAESAAGTQETKHVATLSLKKGSAALSTAARVEGTTDPTPAPSITGLGAAPSSADVLSLISAPSTPILQPKVSSGLRGGTPIYQPRPAYPEIAKRNGLSGDVVLKFLVTKAGTVTNVRVVSGNPTLATAAMQSIKLWRYRPFLLNGEATEAESQATIKFTAPK